MFAGIPMTTGMEQQMDMMSPQYHRGYEQGFASAKSILAEELKKIYKAMKKDNLKWAKEVKKIKIEEIQTMTTSSHRCNCEFCEI